MGLKSRTKGKSGEREIAALVRDLTDWDVKRRVRQYEAIRGWRPWELSTGPATDEGKAVASQNALKRGLRSAEWLADLKRVNDLLRACRDRRGRSV